MSHELLSVQPGELKFTFEVGKQSTCALQLVNNTDHYVAFKMKTTSPRKYCVRPNTAVILPRASCDVTVIMQAQREAPPELQCKDKFLLQSIIVPSGTDQKDIPQDMFTKESGKALEECKLRVVYSSPTSLSPSPVSPSTASASSSVPVSSEEETLRKASLTDNGNQNAPLLDATPNGFSDAKAKLAETQMALSRATYERDAAIQQCQQLQQELVLMKKLGSPKPKASFSFLFVFLVALLGVLVGYLVRS
eukprot:Gb_34621 [translate_table: standard]